MTQHLPLAEYRRLSRKGDREEERLRSPEFQRSSIAGFGEGIGRTVKQYPVEMDVSGSKVSRKVLDEILADLRAGLVGGIVVAKLDRLSRMKPKDRVMLFEEIEDAGGVVLSASEQLDPSTPEGRFARDVFLGIARMQWEKYKEGFDNAKKAAMKDGKPVGPTPFGYWRCKDGTLEPHELDGPVLTETFVIAGQRGLHAALEYITANASKGTWTISTVRRLLKKTSYLGTHTYGDLTTSIPPLVTRIAWEAAQNIPAVQTRKSPGTFPLSGLARCATCEGPMVGGRGGANLRTYRCAASLASSRHDCDAPATVVATRLESHVTAIMQEALSDHPGFAGGEDLNGLLEDAEKGLQAAVREMDGLTGDLTLRRTLGADRFNQMVALAMQELDEARARYQEIAQRIGSDEHTDAADPMTANLRALEKTSRGALDAVFVTKGRGPLDERVWLVPKGSPAHGRV